MLMRLGRALLKRTEAVVSFKTLQRQVPPLVLKANSWGLHLEKVIDPQYPIVA